MLTQQPLVVFVPQERALPDLANSLRDVTRELLNIVTKLELGAYEASALVFSELVREKMLNSISASFLIDVLVSAHWVWEDEKPVEVELPERGWKIILNLQDGEMEFADKRLDTAGSISWLSTPQGALEYCIVKLIVEGVRRFTERSSRTALLIIDEVAIHCDPVLKLKLVQELVELALSTDKIAVCMTTHDPDVLSKTLSTLEKNLDRYDPDSVKVHYLRYSREERGYVADVIDLERVGNVIVPAREIELFKRAAQELA